MDLKSQGYLQFVSDQCVYMKGTGADRTIVCTWVDDIILCTTRGNTIGRETFDAELRSEFEVSPWIQGEAGWILNMRVQRDWNKGTLHLSQEAAIEKLAIKFELTDKESSMFIPMDPSLKSEAEQDTG